MQFRLYAALVVFIGSYLPLSLILLAQDFKYEKLSDSLCIDFYVPASKCSLPFYNSSFSIPIFLICLICFLITLFTVKTVKTKRRLTVKTAKYVPADLMNYSLPYVVAFMSISYSETGKFTGLLIFLGWMFWLTHKSGQLLLNPLLIAFGWRLYEITFLFSGDTVERNSHALSVGELLPGTEIAYVPIQDIYVLREIT